MKARISHLHRTEAEWLKFAQWQPDAGELIVYDPDENYTYARIKVGDGQRTLQELDFFVDSVVTEALKNVQLSGIIDSGRITEYIE